MSYESLMSGIFILLLLVIAIFLVIVLQRLISKVASYIEMKRHDHDAEETAESIRRFWGKRDESVDSIRRFWGKRDESYTEYQPKNSSPLIEESEIMAILENRDGKLYENMHRALDFEKLPNDSGTKKKKKIGKGKKKASA
jgi:hypothetical protein